MTAPCPVCNQNDWCKGYRRNGSPREDCRQCARDRHHRRKHRATEIPPGEIDWLHEPELEAGEDVQRKLREAGL